MQFVNNAYRKEITMDFEKVVSVKNMRESDARTIAERTPSAE